MTKQEEIREGIARKLAEIEGFTWDWIVEEGFEDEWLGKADQILRYLHDNDVVIKVKKELPNIQFIKGNQAFVDAVKKAGYVAVEPLIEEK